MSNVNFTGTAAGVSTSVGYLWLNGPLVLKTGLMSIIQPLTGLSATSVVWDEDPQPMVSDVDRALVTLKLGSYASNGVDEVQSSFDDVRGYQTVQVGQRNVTLTIRVETYDKSVEASEILERLRIRLRRGSVGTSLNNIRLALQTIDATQKANTKYDNRVMNVSIMDIHLAAVSRDNLNALGVADTYIATTDPIVGTYS